MKNDKFDVIPTLKRVFPQCKEPINYYNTEVLDKFYEMIEYLPLQNKDLLIETKDDVYYYWKKNKQLRIGQMLYNITSEALFDELYEVSIPTFLIKLEKYLPKE